MSEFELVRISRRLRILSILVLFLAVLATPLVSSRSAAFESCFNCIAIYDMGIDECDDAYGFCKAITDEPLWYLTCNPEFVECYFNLHNEKNNCLATCEGEGGGSNPVTCNAACGEMYHVCRTYESVSYCFPKRQECIEACTASAE